MDFEQYTLTKIIEECAEIQQICAKAIRFGCGSHPPGSDQSNLEILEEEFNDLIAAIRVFNELNRYSINVREQLVLNSITKTKKYLQYSVDLGKVDPNK